MKKMYALLCMLSLLPLVIVGFSLPQMADQVPLHYNLVGEIDRWGSKYEQLAFPGIVLLLGAYLIWQGWILDKKHQEKAARLVVWTGLASLSLMNGVNIWLLSLAAGADKGNAATPVDMGRALLMIVGLLMSVLGFLMPKTPMNSRFGLRTSWSMSSERAWAACQCFGGRLTTITGAVMVISGVLSAGTIALLLFIGCFALWVAASFLGSWWIYRKQRAIPHK